MAESLSSLPGYKTRTIDYKTTKDGPIKLDVAYPEDLGASAKVLVHIHGGFLLVGNRYSFMPLWLVNACVKRKWIFVTPDYRLIPETTAHSSVEDSVDAYQWVRDALPKELGCEVDSVVLAGSSAGGYLALATATRVQQKPDGLLLVYGMLDATNSLYLPPGQNIWGQPSFESTSTLEAFPHAGKDDTRKTVSHHELPANPTEAPRFGLIAAVHINAVFPDYMTGVDGLAKAIKEGGENAIPDAHRTLFPLSFGKLQGMPKTFLLHGKNDSAVPVGLSVRAEKDLKKAGVEVQIETPEDAEHGFDGRMGNIDVEALEGDSVTPPVQALKNAVQFLDKAMQ